MNARFHAGRGARGNAHPGAARECAPRRGAPSLDIDMNIHLSLTPLISLIAGILILVMPKLLNFIVAIYLIAIGLIGLFGMSSLRLH